MPRATGYGNKLCVAAAHALGASPATACDWILGQAQDDGQLVILGAGCVSRAAHALGASLATVAGWILEQAQHDEVLVILGLSQNPPGGDSRRTY